jgi:energy-coupling factor transport system ATP-binding protein
MDCLNSPTGCLHPTYNQTNIGGDKGLLARTVQREQEIHPTQSTSPSQVESPEYSPLLEVQNLSFRYPAGGPALDSIDLSIHPGDRLALVGHNGAGKTTLVKHLNGLLRPISGTILFEGKPLEGSHLTKARLQIGLLSQDPDDQLFCNTLDEDIAFGPHNQGLNLEETEERVQKALRAIGLESFRYKAPHHLSYGQKKRAALATLLSMEPQVLILDEPTANLDPKQERLFLDLLRGFDGTLICISHDLLFLYEICSRAVVLENGRIHHDFSMQELVSEVKYLRAHGLDFTFRFSCCRDDGEGPHHPHPHHHHHHHATVQNDSHSPLAFPQAAEKTSPAGLIHLEDFSFRYPDGSWGLRNVDLVIEEGESVAIVGENGAGKSTLVSCLAGILEGEGTYSFRGEPVGGGRKEQLWREIGLAFQDPADQLFCPSCAEEVAFGPKQLRLPSEEIQKRVDESLERVRLKGFEERVPHHLSAGERKRIALAAVLSMNPRLIILDEPTANLDPQSEELLCQILMQLQSTRILVSHDMDIIALLSRRTIVMHKGRVIRDYPTAEFIQDKSLVSINGLDYTFKNACCQEIMRLQDRANG